MPAIFTKTGAVPPAPPAQAGSPFGLSGLGALHRVAGLVLGAAVLAAAGPGLVPVKAAGIDSAMVDVAPAALRQVIAAPTTRAWENPLPTPRESMIGPVRAALPGQPGVWIGDRIASQPAAGTRAFGSFGIPYTSTRVQLGQGTRTSRAKQLSASFPYRTVGKLFFTLPNGRRTHCTASVIQRGIIVTAAHCVAGFGAGSGNYYRNFVFVPAFHGPGAGPTAPYGNWRARMVAAPTSWMRGTDPGCGAARANDIAVLALRPQRGRPIGNVVGRLGYGWNDYSFVSSRRTGRLTTGAVSTFGYPAILDRGNIMQRVDGPTYPTNLCRRQVVNYWQGSNVGGGASGGPLVVNFGAVRPQLVGGATQGNDPVMAVIGVTSWGAADPNRPKDNYATRFGQNRIFSSGNYGGRGAGNIGALVHHVCSRLGRLYCW